MMGLWLFWGMLTNAGRLTAVANAVNRKPGSSVEITFDHMLINRFKLRWGSAQLLALRPRTNTPPGASVGAAGSEK